MPREPVPVFVPVCGRGAASIVPGRAGWKLLALAALIAGAACSSTSPGTRPPAPSAVSEDSQGAAAPRGSGAAPRQDSTAADSSRAPGVTDRPGGLLDLDTALELADEHHPELRAAQAYLRAATGRVIQAGAWINPRLEASIEGAPFEGRTTGDAEYLVGATQTLPLGGRLGAATTAARAEEKRRTHEASAARRRVREAVRRSFFVVLYTERLVEVERRLLETAESVVTIARARVAAGEAAADEASRAELEAEGLRLRVAGSEAALEEARLALAESMGRPDMNVSEVDGDLYDSLDLPALDDLLERVDDHPELLAAAARLEENEARLRLAEVERIPDVDVGFAYRRFEETETDAFDVNFGIPLPFFNRNQGAVAEARAGVEAARAEARSQRTSFETRARLLDQKLRQALRAVSIYRDELVPRAQAVLAAAEARYQAGDASLVELLPIRRDAARLELEALDAVRELTLRWSELESLVSAE